MTGSGVITLMEKILIQPFNVIDNTALPEIPVDTLPADGDELEIRGDTYFVCHLVQKMEAPAIGVIPLIVRNPSKIPNIRDYIECLSIAHRRVLFKNSRGMCDLENCDEMIVT
jgi:hypothetical protein